MQYIAATGGLGNQMFTYAFMVARSKKGHATFFHPYGRHSYHYGQEGLQVDKVFKLRDEDRHFSLRVFAFSSYWCLSRLFPHRIQNFLYKMIGIDIVQVPQNFVYYPYITERDYTKALFRGTWQSEMYFKGVEDDVRRAFQFREDLLNEQTRLTGLLIDSSPASASVHIRRNDYLSEQYISGFGGICTKEYYKTAITRINELFPDITLYFFSDDINWCREVFFFKNAVFVDWNIGKDSWQDMYLMSKCLCNIIANSTFSWWGAWLNRHPNKVVIAPKKWWNGIDDDVVPETWIRL